MSVFVNIFGSQAVRRERRARTRAARSLHSPQATRTRWYRFILAVCLLSLACITFIEVVLMPGKLVRRHFEPDAIAQMAAPDPIAKDDRQIRLPFGWQTDEQKAKQKQDELNNIQLRLHSAHQRLDELYQKLVAAREASDAYCQTKLKVLPNPAAGSTVPKSLVDVVANEPTAQVAWAQLLQTQNQAAVHLKAARELLDSVAAHFTAGSFLAEDEHDMLALLDGMNQSLSDVNGSRDDVDHIATLQRARAGLAHQPPTEDNPRNPP
jgi:hypothetical protein